jgi:hypothetical protein
MTHKVPFIVAELGADADPFMSRLAPPSIHHREPVCSANRRFFLISYAIGIRKYHAVIATCATAHSCSRAQAYSSAAVLANAGTAALCSETVALPQPKLIFGWWRSASASSLIS